MCTDLIHKLSSVALPLIWCWAENHHLQMASAPDSDDCGRKCEQPVLPLKDERWKAARWKPGTQRAAKPDTQAVVRASQLQTFRISSNCCFRAIKVETGLPQSLTVGDGGIESHGSLICPAARHVTDGVASSTQHQQRQVEALHVLHALGVTYKHSRECK